jgi:hypothetical protein
MLQSVAAQNSPQLNLSPLSNFFSGPYTYPLTVNLAHFHTLWPEKSVYIRGCIQKFPDWPPGATELQMVQLSATRCSCIAILWVSIVSFAAITLHVASQQVMPKVSVYFVIDSVRILTDTYSYWCSCLMHSARVESWNLSQYYRYSDDIENDLDENEGRFIFFIL